jgi:tryptophan-rich hypothetical protein
MSQVNPKKLRLSKWTAVEPRNSEKHFLVTDVLCDELDVPQTCILEAVHSHRKIQLPWRALADAMQWKVGWK